MANGARSVWVLRLDGVSAGGGAAARLLSLERPGVSACLVGDALWVQGHDEAALPPGGEAATSTERALRRSGGARFRLDPDGQLVPEGARLPAAERLPAGPWRPLGELLRLALPPARAVVAEAPGQAALRLVRDERDPGPDPCGLLVVDARGFAAWAVGAPAVRLAPLRIAARGDGPELLVRGAPLPPLPGARYVLDGPLALPAGLRLEPAVDAASLSSLLRLEPDDLLLASGGPGAVALERVPGAAFVAASRGAARDLLGAGA